MITLAYPLGWRADPSRTMVEKGLEAEWGNPSCCATGLRALIDGCSFQSATKRKGGERDKRKRVCVHVVPNCVHLKVNFSQAIDLNMMRIPNSV